MPFTLAHPAFVIPLRRAGLPLAALSVGAMVPDLPLYAGAVVDSARTHYAFTHSLVGLFTVDLLVGMLGWLVWRDLLREPLHDALPGRLRARAVALRGSQPRDLRAHLLGAVAILIGAASHILLDEFTHAGRSGATYVPWLAERHAGLLGTQWAQYVGGVGGLLVIAAAMLWSMIRATSVPAARRCPQVARWVTWAPVATGLLVLAVVAGALAGGATIKEVAYDSATQGVLAVAAAAVGAALAWQIAVRRGSRSAD